ncbi:angiogenic factor with G patch and FHA domains 1-like isoform X1 [Dendroctonus ponderosae]
MDSRRKSSTSSRSRSGSVGKISSRSSHSSLEAKNSANGGSNYGEIHKLDEELMGKLKEFPEVLELVQKMQRIIQKQVKKIIKWKLKYKQMSERKTRHASTQTHFSSGLTETTSTNGQKEPKSLAEDIKEAAEQAVQSSGFVYEETSGLYYDYTSGYYYNAEYGLYYDASSGTYLNYNQETKTYEYHSQVTPAEPAKDSVCLSRKKRRAKNKKKAKEPKRPRFDEFGIDFEEGECSDSSATFEDDECVSDSSDVSKQYPPCMRMIVESTEIPKIKVGSLFIVTCDGGTIGREGNHSVLLPDINVSKHHLKLFYNEDTSTYSIVDLGSRNGTLLNGKRLASSKQESDPAEVPHGSKLQLGSTTLLCHVHEGSQTCGHCEPGLLIEEPKDPPVPISGSKKSISQQFKSELRRLRKQHGFLGSNEDPSRLREGYTDRAERRRNEVGSQNPYEKTKAASLDESITSENKGFKLLSKMGWKEGESLGKDGTGRIEPVKVVSNAGTAGMGAAVEVPLVVPKNPKHQIWMKTQERFNKLPEENPLDEPVDLDQ